MKKNTLLYVGLAGAAAYFLLTRKKSASEKKAETEEIAAEVETETGDKVDAVIKTPAGQIQEGIEQAKQIAETVKSGVVAIKDIATGTTAIVRSSKAKERQAARKAKREAQRAARKSKITARKAARKTRRKKKVR